MAYLAKRLRINAKINHVNIHRGNLYIRIVWSRCKGNLFDLPLSLFWNYVFGERSIDLIKIILLTKNGHTFFEVWIPLTNQIRGRVFRLNLWPKGEKGKARFRILEYRPRKWAWWDIYYISGFKGEDHNSNRLLISGSQSDNHPV